MAIARVVSFDGVDSARMAELSREIEGGEQPEGMQATEMLLLHDADADQALAIIFFDNEDDYRRATRSSARCDGGHPGPAHGRHEVPGRNRMTA
jgi:hypothetical protein